MSSKLCPEAQPPCLSAGTAARRRGVELFPETGHRVVRAVSARSPHGENRAAQGGIQMEQGVLTYRRKRITRSAAARSTSSPPIPRQSGRHQDQGPGTGRARQSRCHSRSVRHSSFMPSTTRSANKRCRRSVWRRPTISRNACRTRTSSRLGHVLAGDDDPWATTQRPS